MQLKDIKTVHKLRDYRICQLYLEENLSPEEISSHIKLSTRQISRIIYKNRSVIKLEKDWEKLKRIHWIKKQIAKNPTTKKDSADLQEQLKRELEGDTALANIYADKIQIFRPEPYNEESMETSSRTTDRSI